MSDDRFKEVISLLYKHRKQKGKFTPIAQERMVTKLCQYSKKVVIAAVTATIDNGWTGVFPEKYTDSKNNQRNKPKYIYDTIGVAYKLGDDGRYYHPKNGSVYIP